MNFWKFCIKFGNPFTTEFTEKSSKNCKGVIIMEKQFLEETELSAHFEELSEDCMYVTEGACGGGCGSIVGKSYGPGGGGL